MAKKKDFGFRTPVRRGTKNVTGHKVGGELTGGECQVVRSHKIEVNSFDNFLVEMSPDTPTALFNSDIAILAVGGYFKASTDVTITFCITIGDDVSTHEEKLSKDRYYSIGHDYEVSIEDLENKTVEGEIKVESQSSFTLEYTQLSMGFISKEYYIDSEDIYRHYANSKKRICFPEQFYFDTHLVLPNSIEGSPIILKSCNRCQRFLPINHENQRIHLAFSNHCTTKAPCVHPLFSKYKIVKSELSKEELSKFIDNDTEDGFSLNDNSVISYNGHQLECKACKKFFVNAALNHLRSSSQHREDSLRRRAFELLIRHLLKMKWIYHSFRIKTGKEFDREIWVKFNKKCFKCGVSIKSAKEMHLDHTMPLSHLYPLDETATCLCATCNNAKSDIFPIDFYTKEELKSLSEITGIPLELISSREPNQVVIDALKKNIKWFFDDFLNHPEYIKERDGKRAADSIFHSVSKAVSKSKTPYDLKEEYNKPNEDANT